MQRLLPPVSWGMKVIGDGINYLAVRPDCQRRGLARQIMEDAEKLLREAGCPKINLQIRATNTEVIEFYKSIGYQVDDVVSMGKRLEADEPYQVK